MLDVSRLIRLLARVDPPQQPEPADSHPKGRRPLELGTPAEGALSTWTFEPSQHDRKWVILNLSPFCRHIALLATRSLTGRRVVLTRRSPVISRGSSSKTSIATTSSFGGATGDSSCTPRPDWELSWRSPCGIAIRQTMNSSPIGSPPAGSRRHRDSSRVTSSSATRPAFSPACPIARTTLDTTTAN